METQMNRFRSSALACLFLVLGCTTTAPPVSAEPLILDYTAYVEGAVQVSGIGVSADGRIGLVTDFEQVLLVDPETVETTTMFSVQLGALPEQGASEAIAFVDDDIAVLYPEDARIRMFSREGVPGRDVLIEEAGRLHGAMSVDERDIARLIATRDTGPVLLAIDLDNGRALGEKPLTLDAGLEVNGLSVVLGQPRRLWATTASNEVYVIDAESGEVTLRSPLPRVGEASGCESFVNPMGETVLAIADDADEFNDVPGPLRLYLVD